MNWECEKVKCFKVYFNNIPEGHRPMWIYTMYASMSTGKYKNSKHYIDIVQFFFISKHNSLVTFVCLVGFVWYVV